MMTSLGFSKVWGVTTRSRKGQDDPFALFHKLIAQYGVLGSDALHGDRRVCPQELFDGGRDELWLLNEAAAVFGIDAKNTCNDPLWNLAGVFACNVSLTIFDELPDQLAAQFLVVLPVFLDGFWRKEWQQESALEGRSGASVAMIDRSQFLLLP